MRSFFFFQAEDGIRDLYVTGVQTCALPIFGREQPRPVTKYDGCNVQPQYVGQPGRQHLVTDLPAAHHAHILAASNFLGAGNGLLGAADEPEPVAQPGLRRRGVGDDEDWWIHLAGRLGAVPHLVVRSEEHTSELQSRRDLVCRLLLEKKKGPEAGFSRHGRTSWRRPTRKKSTNN